MALVVACAVPLGGFTSVAFSDRGIGGTIDDRFDELTSETETGPSEQGAGRLTAASSTRGKYWREAGDVFDDRPAVGVGAGNFQAARLRHRSDPSRTRHAHGFVPQTLADLGSSGWRSRPRCCWRGWSPRRARPACTRAASPSGAATATRRPGATGTATGSRWSRCR